MHPCTRERQRRSGAQLPIARASGLPEVPSDYQFIGQITSVWPPHDVPFPMVDRAAPVSVIPDPAYERLISGPGNGVTSLYLDAHGSVRLHFSCS